MAKWANCPGRRCRRQQDASPEKRGCHEEIEEKTCHCCAAGQSNPTVYGPPEEVQTQQEEENGSGGTTGSAGSTGTAGEANSSAGITNEAGTISATGVTNGVFVPDDNINEDVYGPPADME